MSLAITFRDYYQLTKPGIVRGNIITAVAGFLFASGGAVNAGLMLATLGGIALIIASSCVVNNYIDRAIDKKMARTKNRALVTGNISVRSALFFAASLGLLGFGILLVFTNLVTVIIGLIGVIDYVVIYGYFKRRSVHGTLVGGISGSTSLIAGYTAVTGHFDLAVFLLFLIMFIWQMPHFYAIAIYRLKDYQAAKLPVLSVKKGVSYTQAVSIIYIGLYVLATTSLHAFGFASKTFLIVMFILGIAWIWVAILGLSKPDHIKWGHSVFGFSLIVLLVFSALLSVDNFLP